MYLFFERPHILKERKNIFIRVIFALRGKKFDSQFKPEVRSKTISKHIASVGLTKAHPL
jgi:hypothetical protein